MNDKLKAASFLSGTNANFIEELYKSFQKDPSKVDKSWRKFFDDSTIDINEYENIPVQGSQSHSFIDHNVYNRKTIIQSYRDCGHYLATLDPLGLEKVISRAEVNLNLNGEALKNLTVKLNPKHSTDKYTLRELIEELENLYCRTLGVEFTHVKNNEEQNFLYESFENRSVSISKELKLKSLSDLNKVAIFEHYLHTKFPGAKRFSIEGGDSVIAALQFFITEASGSGVTDIVIGMAHRGRLATLTQVMNKPYSTIFAEFLGIQSSLVSDPTIAGDVKYHMGYNSSVINGDKKTNLTLAPNPSHLEAVNTVVMGMTKAKQDLTKIAEGTLAILVHGDAAFCGQGVVAEGLVMSSLPAYSTRGVVHFVINNQIGFTTNSRNAKSGRYNTEFAKIIGAPIIHVNGDDIEAVLFATKIALDYQQKFNKDFIIDIICYRKYGHNEGDEPMYTQPLMYNAIKDKISPVDMYAQKLVSSGDISQADFTLQQQKFKTELEYAFDNAKTVKDEHSALQTLWQNYSQTYDNLNIITGIDKQVLQALGHKANTIPKSLHVNAKLTKILEQRLKNLQEDVAIDWATAEQLAYATILTEGYGIRMSGQDCQRGTFSHRHAVIHSQIDDNTYVPLNNLKNNQGKLVIEDSNLSEYGVLGFEYGYSTINPKALVIWEAQFGDFVNGAQIIIDQFIASGETKWLQMSGLVMLLPHGMEGQGPEHSSARLERFLQLAAQDNMQIVNPTTPASIFHLLRCQIHASFRKPLIIMSPKSLLRHRLAVAKLDDLGADTHFKKVLDESELINIDQIDKIIFCSGKIYYDLYEERQTLALKNIVIIRLEQLYPFPSKEILALLAKYKKAKDLVWCQEEHQNMGAWQFIWPIFNQHLKESGYKLEIAYVGRPYSASPATGYMLVHAQEQKTLIQKALTI